MNSEVSLVEEVRFSVLSRRIKIIGIVIIVALFYNLSRRLVRYCKLR